jgi:hypothetical protein
LGKFLTPARLQEQLFLQESKNDNIPAVLVKDRTAQLSVVRTVRSAAAIAARRSFFACLQGLHRLGSFFNPLS